MSASNALLPSSLWEGRLFNGEWVEGVADAEVLEPATGQRLGQIALTDAAGMAQACAAAAAAQPAWAALGYEQRADVLRRAGELARTHGEEIAMWLTREGGSSRIKAGTEANISAKCLLEASQLPSASQGEVLPSADAGLSLARRRPLGVVGVIPPFNFPLYLAMRAVAPALALGNAVVLKPDPRTAVCGGVVIARLLQLAGLPKGVLQMVPGDGAAGAALTSDPHVAAIQFTGSTAAGRKVGEACGKHLKKVSLELGGKNALLVLDDADLDLAVNNAAWGSFLHQGQICMATGRILVQRALYPAFVEKLVAKVKTIGVGDPWVEPGVLIGPLINVGQRDNCHRIVQAAVAGGAQLLAGGQYQGLIYQPTVLTDVAPSNPAFREEIFGPVAVVTPFDSDAEGIALANDSEYGLSMGVITGNIGRVLAFADQLKAGLLHINDQTVKDDVIEPFGGVRASGNGTSVGGLANAEEFTQWQWLTIRPQPVSYPV
jgi:benzaldehyde dehydrogenase (NAD)